MLHFVAYTQCNYCNGYNCVITVTLTQVSVTKKFRVQTTESHISNSHSTVRSTKSDSDVIFCLQIIRELESIDHLYINPIHRIGLIHK